MEQHKELQLSKLHKENQPMKRLEEAVEEIRKLRLRLAEEVVNKEKLDRGEPARATGEMQKQ
jgi:hypothetical protein